MPRNRKRLLLPVQPRHREIGQIDMQRDGLGTDPGTRIGGGDHAFDRKAAIAQILQTRGLKMYLDGADADCEAWRTLE